MKSPQKMLAKTAKAGLGGIQRPITTELCRTPD